MTARTWRDIPSDVPHRVGGTTAAALLGLCPPTWRGASPWGLWAAAQGQVEHAPDADVLRRGRALEGPILAMYAARTGARLDRGAIVQDVAEPWRVGTLDALTLAPAAAPVVIEAKSHLDPAPYGPDGSTWTDWPDDGEQTPCPAHEWVQALWYISLVPGCIGADLAVMLPTPGHWDPLVRQGALAALSTTPEAAAAFIREWYASPVPPAPAGQIRVIHLRPRPHYVSSLVAAVREARDRILVRGEEPPIDASLDCRDALQSRPRGRRIRMAGELLDLYRSAVMATETAARAADLRQLARNYLLAAMGDARVAVSDTGERALIDATGALRLS